MEERGESGGIEFFGEIFDGGAIEGEALGAGLVDAGVPPPIVGRGFAESGPRFQRIWGLPFAGDGEVWRGEALTAEGDEALDSGEENEAIGEVTPLGIWESGEGGEEAGADFAGEEERWAIGESGHGVGGIGRGNLAARDFQFGEGERGAAFGVGEWFIEVVPRADAEGGVLGGGFDFGPSEAEGTLGGRVIGGEAEENAPGFHPRLQGFFDGGSGGGGGPDDQGSSGPSDGICAVRREEDGRAIGARFIGSGGEEKSLGGKGIADDHCVEGGRWGVGKVSGVIGERLVGGEFDLSPT